MKRYGVLALAGMLGLLAAGSFSRPTQADTDAAPTAVDERLRQQVGALLKQKCLACHGDDPKELKGKLDLRTRVAAIKGGDSGEPAFVAGKPSDSLLYRAVQRSDPSLVMPPKENERLTAAEIELVGRWIKQGAPWPEFTRPPPVSTKPWDDSPPDGIIIVTSGGRSAEWNNRKYKPEDVWAYRPVQRPKVPEFGLNGKPIAHPVDAFLQQKLREKGVARIAPPADRRTLIRRASFDLTGLPPTPEEVEAFVQDPSPDAWPKLVDRLLASPHYGERMAQHWLDVVRYADTAGYANDFERPNAWRYRDYVVRSFNHDKPYDRFVKEQLAGDELAADDPELAIAVGFLRMGPWEQTGMSVAAETRQQFLDDVTHSVGVTFLAQGLRCASCHDHKFDPVPTKDYYRMQAVFAPVQFAERPVPFLSWEKTDGFADSRAVVEHRLQQARDARAAIKKKSDDAIEAYLKERGVARLADIPDVDRPKRDRFGLTKLELSLIRIFQKRIETFERELLRYQPYAFTVYNGPPAAYSSNRPLNPLPASREGKVQEIRVLLGGALASPAEVVSPGVLSAVHGSNDVLTPSAWNTLPQTMEGRRLALANWIASPTNPLTARVIVNRVWQMHFGKGLVATPNNFGKMGKRPTHPDLLDWLATWFVEHGWSIKKLHRLILTSAAYQQASSHPDMEKLREVDGNNELLAYYPPRRLSAEELRDAMLAVSGELNRTLGGPGVFPEINWETALQPRHVMGSVAPAYQPSRTPAERNRRTLYAFRQRTLADPLLEVFNRPTTETSCDCRDSTTVAPQAFALMNSEFAHDRAIAFALSLESQAKTLDERITLAFRRACGRMPAPEELTACRQHVENMLAQHQANPPTPIPLPTKIQRKMVEEMTGEEFSWEEELDGLKGYVRDKKPWDVPVETRALADFCLVLFNLNEFAYVR